MTAIPFDNKRTTPVSMVGDFTAALQGAGVIDYLWLWDEMSGWFPGDLWRPEMELEYLKRLLRRF